MVTIILNQADNATEIIKFIVNHINEIDLLVHNVTIGEFAGDHCALDVIAINFPRRSHCASRDDAKSFGHSEERD